MKKRGFTFIELIIALAVGAILTGIGVPRLNGFIQEQQFQGDLQRLSGCVRQAREMAAAAKPVSADDVRPVRFVKAVLQASPDGQGIMCGIKGEAVSTNGNQVVGMLRFDSALVPVATVGPTVASLSAGSILRIIFGQAEGGAPVGAALTQVLTGPPPPGGGTSDIVHCPVGESYNEGPSGIPKECDTALGRGFETVPPSGSGACPGTSEGPLPYAVRFNRPGGEGGRLPVGAFLNMGQLGTSISFLPCLPI